MSHDLVSIAVEGGVVTKPSLTHIKSGVALVKFGLVCEPKRKASGSRVKDNMYFTVSVIGKTAETVFSLIKPGMPIRVEGEYQDGIFRDAVSDIPKIGRIIYATRVKSFVFWKYRRKGEKYLEEQEQQEHIDNMRIPDFDDLPF